MLHHHSDTALKCADRFLQLLCHLSFSWYQHWTEGLKSITEQLPESEAVGSLWRVSTFPKTKFPQGSEVHAQGAGWLRRLQAQFFPPVSLQEASTALATLSAPRTWHGTPATVGFGAAGGNLCLESQLHRGLWHNCKFEASPGNLARFPGSKLNKRSTQDVPQWGSPGPARVRL